jgi:hypothetical protein
MLTSFIPLWLLVVPIVIWVAVVAVLERDGHDTNTTRPTHRRKLNRKPQ